MNAELLCRSSELLYNDENENDTCFWKDASTLHLGQKAHLYNLLLCSTKTNTFSENNLPVEHKKHNI